MPKMPIQNGKLCSHLRKMLAIVIGRFSGLCELKLQRILIYYCIEKQREDLTNKIIIIINGTLYSW